MLRIVPVRVWRGRREVVVVVVGRRLDCRRVLIVSIGKRETSTVRPARAPA